MKFDATRKTMKCLSQDGSEVVNSRQSCRSPFKKVNIFGHGMQEKQHYRRGKLIEDGSRLRIHFKKFKDPRKHSVKDNLLPLQFKNYCVSKMHKFDVVDT